MLESNNNLCYMHDFVSFFLSFLLIYLFKVKLHIPLWTYRFFFFIFLSINYLPECSYRYKNGPQSVHKCIFTSELAMFRVLRSCTFFALSNAFTCSISSANTDASSQPPMSQSQEVAKREKSRLRRIPSLTSFVHFFYEHSI